MRLMFTVEHDTLPCVCGVQHLLYTHIHTNLQQQTEIKEVLIPAVVQHHRERDDAYKAEAADVLAAARYTAVVLMLRSLCTLCQLA
jgi:hypothetical protein